MLVQLRIRPATSALFLAERCGVGVAVAGRVAVSGEAFARMAQRVEMKRRVFGEYGEKDGECVRVRERCGDGGVAFSCGVEEHVTFGILDTHVGIGFARFLYSSGCDLVSSVDCDSEWFSTVRSPPIICPWPLSSSRSSLLI